MTASAPCPIPPLPPAALIPVQDVHSAHLSGAPLLWRVHGGEAPPRSFLCLQDAYGQTPRTEPLLVRALTGQALVISAVRRGEGAGVLGDVHLTLGSEQLLRGPGGTLGVHLSCAQHNQLLSLLALLRAGPGTLLVLSERPLQERVQHTIDAAHPPHTVLARTGEAMKPQKPLLSAEPSARYACARPGDLVPLPAADYGVSPERWDFSDAYRAEANLQLEQGMIAEELELSEFALREQLPESLLPLLDHVTQLARLHGMRLGGRLALRAQADNGLFDASGLSAFVQMRLDPNLYGAFLVVARWARVIERLVEGPPQQGVSGWDVASVGRMVGPQWKLVRDHLQLSERVTVRNNRLVRTEFSALPNPGVALMVLNHHARTWLADYEATPYRADPTRDARAVLSRSLAHWAYRLKQNLLQQWVKDGRVVSTGTDYYKDNLSASLLVLPKPGEDWPHVYVHVPAQQFGTWLNTVPQVRAPLPPLWSPDEIQAMCAPYTIGQAVRALNANPDAELGLVPHL